MSSFIRAFPRAPLAALILFALSPLRAQELQDSYGDPLPPGAAFRLGTTRYRQGGKINSVTISPDSKTILTGSTNFTTTLWDLESGRRLRTFIGHTSAVFAADYSPDLHTAVSGGYDGTAILWDLQTGEALKKIETGMTVHKVKFTPDGKTLVIACDQGKIQLWSVKTGALERTIEGVSGEVHGLALRPDGKSCFAAGQDPTIRQWDLATGKELRTFTGHSKPVFSVAVSRDGKTLASACDDRNIGLWDVDTGELLRKIQLPESWPTYVDFAPDGTSVLVSQNWSNPALYDVKTGGRLTEFRDGHRDYVHAAAVSPDGKFVVSGGFDRLLVLWNLQSGLPVHSFEAQRAEIRGVAYSPDGSVLGAVGDDQSVSLWDTQTWKRLKATKSLDGRLYALSFSPDGRLLAYGGESQKIFIRDARSLQKVFTYPTKCVVWFSTFHPSSQVVFANEEEHTFAARELPAGNILRTFDGHRGIVKCVAVTADGKTVASGSWDQTIILWDYETGKPIRTLRGHSALVYCLAFTSTGKHLVSAGKDRTMILWNAVTGEKMDTFEGFEDTVAALAVSPDDQYVLASSWDKKTILWDPWRHKRIQVLTGHLGSHQACAWSPGGGKMVTGSTDTSALVWDPGLKDAAAAKAWAQEWTRLPEDAKKEQMAAVLEDFGSVAFDRWCRGRSRLAALEEAGLPVLTEKFPPEAAAPSPNGAELEKLLTRLDDDLPAARDKARDDLKTFGSAALPWIDRQLKNSSLSAEVRSGLASVRGDILAHPTSPKDLGRLRAVLFYADLLPKDSARHALLRYAKGPEGSPATQAAQRVLQFN